MNEKSQATGKPAAPTWIKFRLDADVLDGLDAIARWMDVNGKRPHRFGPPGTSRADALRYAVQETLRSVSRRGTGAGAGQGVSQVAPPAVPPAGAHQAAAKNRTRPHRRPRKRGRE